MRETETHTAESSNLSEKIIKYYVKGTITLCVVIFLLTVNYKYETRVP